MYYENTQKGKQCIIFCNKCLKAKHVKSKYLTESAKAFPGFGYFKEKRKALTVGLSMSLLINNFTL